MKTFPLEHVRGSKHVRGSQSFQYWPWTQPMFTENCARSKHSRYAAQRTIPSYKKMRNHDVAAYHRRPRRRATSTTMSKMFGVLLILSAVLVHCMVSHRRHFHQLLDVPVEYVIQCGFYSTARCQISLIQDRRTSRFYRIPSFAFRLPKLLEVFVLYIHPSRELNKGTSISPYEKFALDVSCPCSKATFFVRSANAVARHFLSIRHRIGMLRHLQSNTSDARSNSNQENVNCPLCSSTLLPNTSLVVHKHSENHMTEVRQRDLLFQSLRSGPDCSCLYKHKSRVNLDEVFHIASTSHLLRLYYLTQQASIINQQLARDFVCECPFCHEFYSLNGRHNHYETDIGIEFAATYQTCLKQISIQILMRYVTGSFYRHLEDFVHEMCRSSCIKYPSIPAPDRQRQVSVAELLEFSKSPLLDYGEQIIALMIPCGIAGPLFELTSNRSSIFFWHQTRSVLQCQNRMVFSSQSLVWFSVNCYTFIHIRSSRSFTRKKNKNANPKIVFEKE